MHSKLRSSRAKYTAWQWYTSNIPYHQRVRQGLTSHETHHRSYWGRVFLRVKWPNQQYQSTHTINIPLLFVKLSRWDLPRRATTKLQDWSSEWWLVNILSDTQGVILQMRPFLAVDCIGNYNQTEKNEKLWTPAQNYSFFLTNYNC